MSSRDDAIQRCGVCNADIRSEVEAVWLWDLNKADAVQVGPFHSRCADELLEDDPTRWSREEPV